MSVIRAAGVNPFVYRTEIQRRKSQVFKNPADWLPWNFRDALEIAGREINVEAASAAN